MIVEIIGCIDHAEHLDDVCDASEITDRGMNLRQQVEAGQPGVVNGASELLGEVFGDGGKHARSAVGVAVLPLDAPVEVELVVEVAAP